jgi:hypothetical protein
MDFDKLRRKHTAQELEAAYVAGYLKLTVVNALDPAEPAKDFPNDLRHHYSLNVAQGSVTTTGNPPACPNIGPVVLLIRDVAWPDHLAVRAAVTWFKRIVCESGDRKPGTRDELADRAVAECGISGRQFLDLVWDKHAPAEWKRSGAPRK